MRLAIIGGGVTGLAAAWQAFRDGTEFRLFEATQRLGGIVQTESLEEDLVAEGGAESCLRSKPEFLDLCQELGLEDEVVSTLPENSGAFVVRDGQLHPIPQGFRLMAPSAWWPFLRSDLISWTGKLRAGLDLFLPVKERGHDEVEESLSEFVTRRLGSEVLHYLAQPLVAGIYGADPQALSLEATMPLFQRLEQEHGSVIKGLRSMGTEGQAQGARYNLFFSLKRGFGSVVEALEKQLPEQSLQVGCVVDDLQPEADGKGWEVTVRGGKPEFFDAVVVALPAPQAAKLLASFMPDVASSLQEIKYRGAVTVNICYDRLVYLDHVPRAYGFVVPAEERRPMLACTFSSRKWPHRGSEKQGVLRTYFGGPGMEWALTATDEDLLAVSKTELAALLGLEEEPIAYHVHRWPIGLPEYRVRHRQRVQKIRQDLEVHPGLQLAGNYLDGVGLPDCVRLGRRAVSKVSAALV
jgi:protoporphyrinogen/coproporphyrinogen III oxidase